MQGRVWAMLLLACVPQVVYVAFIEYREWQWLSFALVIVASIGWALSVRALRACPDVLSFRALVALITVVGACMIAFPSRGSNDVFSYAMYGRIVSEHGANPYTALPDEFSGDPLFEAVGRRWTHTPSRYGPVFTGLSAVGTALLPGERLPLRLFFQALTGVGVMTLLILVWRRWRSPAGLAFVGLHPLMMMSVLNGAHNDVFVGLGVFAFVLLLERRQLIWASVALAGAALVKATALLAVLAAAVWFMSRRRIRDALVVGSVTCGVAFAGMLAVPGCVGAIRAAADLNRNSSIWFPVLLFATRPNSFPVHGPHWTVSEVEQFVKTPALAATVVALCVGAWVFRRRDQSGLWFVVALGVATFSVFASWVMPWYLIWALPLMAVARGRVAMMMATHASVLLAIAQLHGFATTNLNVQSWLLLIIVPWAVILGYGLAIRSDAQSASDQPERVQSERAA